MSTSRCYRQFQHNASRVLTRAQKVIQYGISGATAGAIVGEGLLHLHGHEARVPSDFDCVNSIKQLKLQPRGNDIGGLIGSIIFIIIIKGSALMICKGAEAATNAVNVSPSVFFRTAFTLLGAAFGIIKGVTDHIPDSGEELILPERSLSYAGRF